MARISLFQSAALAVLAAVGAMAIPAQAHPEDQEPDRQEARAARQEARQMQAEHQVDAPQQAAEQEAQPAAAPQQQTQSSEAGRTWNRGGGDGGGWQGRTEPREPQIAGSEGGSAPEVGWRSKRASDGQRFGRNWDNSGAVDRPAPAYRGETPRVPERDSADGSPHPHGEGTDGEWVHQRNRTYSDPNRSGTYGTAHDHDRSAESWRNRQEGRNSAYTYGTSDSGYRDQNYGYQNGYNSGSRDFNRWDDDWRRDNRYNWSGYRNQHRDLYRAGRYYSPYSNYGYSRLSIGFFLNRGFYGQSYWINDPWQYRLPQIYGPYRWVRYYDDVLLVDIYSGEVVDVVHNFFW